MPGRYQLITSRAELPPEGRSSRIRYLYDVGRDRSLTSAALLKARRAQELENLIEGWMGALVVVGGESNELAALLSALAPQVVIFHVPAAECDAYDAASALAKALKEAERHLDGHSTLDLKDAPGISVDPVFLTPLLDAWEILDREVIHPTLPITQGDFDAFLSGDRSWRALAAGAAAERGKICKTVKGSVDLTALLLRTVRRVDRSPLDPNEAVSRIRIFAEIGSGCTTLLRQAGLNIARAGYPVLITRPFARTLRPADVNKLIVQVQDAWARHRKGKGSGTGTLPFCLILDADVELAFQGESFVRSLSSNLNRKLVVITAHRRSRSEIDEARDALKLYARTTKPEILKIGKTLREFCTRWGLSPIPTDAEWDAYYSNFGRLRGHVPLPKGGIIETPALFLIGLYPFVRARVRDERSLSRYLYERWAAIEDLDRRRLIEILAVAAVYGCAIPIECLLRDEALFKTATSLTNKAAERVSDLFVEWASYGEHTRNWALHIRHPALGFLLVRALLPQEGRAPYSPLCPLLERMSGSAADVWLAEELTYRLGREFDSDAPRFSLESDTPIQEAARAFFEAIPDEVAHQSRVICHHHARYYVHLLHACLALISEPQSTALSPAVLRSTAERALDEADRLLQIARAITHSRERLSNILTTLAAASLRLSGILAGGDFSGSLKYLKNAVNLANDAVTDDIANGHAIFTYINCIQKLFEAVDVEDIGASEAIRLFNSAEDRLQILIQLKDSRLWRNIEADEAEIAVHRLVNEHIGLSQRLARSSLIKKQVVSSPTARAAITLREILNEKSLKEAFQNPRQAADLRNLREQLKESNTGEALHGLRYLLQLFDPIGRFDFETRILLLDKMALARPDDYIHYLHDHAALAFQLEQVERSEELFSQIRRERVQNPNVWLWHNERIFVSRTQSGIEPREVVVRITDPLEGWATYDRRAKVKIQPYQWGELRKGEYHNAFLRFRLTGLQAVDEKLASFDLETMGIRASDGDPRA